MQKVTPPSDLWYDVVLPKDIKSKAFQNIPYPEILYKCDEFCDSDEFWARKAANDTGNEYNSDFLKFYNEGRKPYRRYITKITSERVINRDEQYLYLRALAYNNVAVIGDENYIGSELYMSPAQMLKIGVNNKDKELIYYSLDNFNKLDKEMFDYSKILKPLVDNNMLDEIKNILPKLPDNAITGFPYLKWFFENEKFANSLDPLIIGADEAKSYYLPYKALYESIKNQEIEDDDLMDPYYVYAYYMAKKYGYNPPEPNINQFIDDGDGSIVFQAMLRAGFVDEAFSLLEERKDTFLDNYPPFIEYIVNNDDVKLGYKLLEIAPEKDKQQIINDFAFESYSGNRIFELAIDKVKLKINIHSLDTTNLVDKSVYDFEGLYRLSKYVKNKKFIIDYAESRANSYMPAINEIFG